MVAPHFIVPRSIQRCAIGGLQARDCSSCVYLSKLIYLSPSPAEEEGAERAEGGAGLAEGTAVETELVAEGGLEVVGDVPFEIELDPVGVCFIGQIEPAGEALHVGVNDYGGRVEALAENHVRGFPSNAGNFQKFLHRLRELLKTCQVPCRSDDRPGLVPEKAERVYDKLDFGLLGQGEFLKRGECPP